MFSNPKVGKNGGHFPCVKKGGDDGDLPFVCFFVCLFSWESKGAPPYFLGRGGIGGAPLGSHDVCLFFFVCVFFFQKRERERERERGKKKEYCNHPTKDNHPGILKEYGIGLSKSKKNHINIEF